MLDYGKYYGFHFKFFISSFFIQYLEETDPSDFHILHEIVFLFMPLLILRSKIYERFFFFCCSKNNCSFQKFAFDIKISVLWFKTITHHHFFSLCFLNNCTAYWLGLKFLKLLDKYIFTEKKVFIAFLI